MCILMPIARFIHVTLTSSCLRGILVQIEVGEATIRSGIALGIGMTAVLVSVAVLEKSRVMEVLPNPRNC